jgi:hypothetical protein
MKLLIAKGAEFFNDKLLQICFDWLSDPVFAIREAATINLKNLVVVFGTEWAVTHVIPQILDLSKSSNYLYRMTVIFAITVIPDPTNSDIGTDPWIRSTQVVLGSYSAEPVKGHDTQRALQRGQGISNNNSNL